MLSPEGVQTGETVQPAPVAGQREVSEGTVFLDRRTWLRYLVFAACAAIYFYPFLRILPGVTDEGTLIYGAVRVVHGEIPYRDFFEVMGPGTFYWQVLFFKVFGVTWLATRLNLLVTSVSTAVVLYFFAREMRLQNAVIPAVLFFATAFGLLWPAISHHGDSTLFALLAFAAFTRWLETRSWILLPLAGMLAGLTTCFLQPKGALLLGAFVITTWISARTEAGMLQRLASLIAGYAGVLLVVLCYFWRRGALNDLVYAIITFPLTDYSGVNSVQYGMGLFSFYGHGWFNPLKQAFSSVVAYPITAAVLVPFFFVALLPALLIVLALANGRQSFSRKMIPYWLAGFALWASELHRKDIMHLVYGSPLLVILCLRLYESRGARVLRSVVPLRICVVLLASLNCLMVLTAQTKIETRRGRAYSSQKNATLEWLQAHIEPGEEIFSYPYRPMYYFLLDAQNATRFSFLLPGYNTPSQFEEVIHSLESKKIRHILWDDSYDNRGFAWAFAYAPQQPLALNTYLNTRYRVVDSRSGIRLLERKQ